MTLYRYATYRRLGLFRTAALAMACADLLQLRLPTLAALPESAYQPMALLAWIHAPLGAGSLAILTLFTVACGFYSLLGLPRARIFHVLFLAGYLFSEAYIRSFGYINHATLGLQIILIYLVFLPSWERFTLRRHQGKRDTEGERSDVAAGHFLRLGLLLTLPYFLIAAYRVCQSGPFAYFSEAMAFYTARSNVRAGYFDMPFGAWILTQPWLLKLQNFGYFVTTVAELASPFIFRNRNAAAVWAIIMLGFHAGTLMFMNILFPHNILLILVLVLWPLTWKRDRNHGWAGNARMEGRASRNRFREPQLSIYSD